MAIEATPCRRAQRPGRGSGSAIGQRSGLARVAGVTVAFLAQERWPCLEQVENVAAMAGMANGAVLGYWLMVVYKGAALLHVALVTGLVDAVLLQLLGVVAMHIVAI